MKEVIYNFLKCFSKVGLFFKRLAVEIRSFRRFIECIKRHSSIRAVFTDAEFVQLIHDTLIDLKD